MPRLRHYQWHEWADWAYRRIEELKPGVIALDTETSGIGFYDAAFCITASWRGPAGIESAYFSLEADPDIHPIVQAVIAAVPTWLFHNAKFDLQKLLLAGVINWPWIEDTRIHDTQTIFHLLNENERKALKHLARVVLKEETNEEAVLRKVRRKLGLKKDDGYQHIPREHLVPYAVKDTEFTLRLFEFGWPRLVKRNDPALIELYWQEQELTKVLLRMEANGFRLDVPYLEATTSEYGARVMEGWQRIVELTGDPDLNPQSPQQLLAAFEARGVHLESTAVDALRGVEDELAQAILAYRQDKKLHTTYLKALLDEQRDGVVHPWFNPTGARTGRMSSGSAAN